VALVAHDCASVSEQLTKTFGWPTPFHDPGVGEFGLTNAVFPVGDTFVEVVSPVQADTTAGRYLQARGGDSGYMAIFQVPDLAAARQRVASAGVRVVWTADLPDMAGTHLHPKDLPGAIVSLDWADPPESWRWGGPAWTGQAPAHPRGGLAGLTIEVQDPAAAGARWASVLGVDARSEDGTAVVHLESARQTLRFVPVGPHSREGIVEVRLSVDSANPGPPVTEIGGVRFVSEAQDQPAGAHKVRG
jgi:hypothetical protein